MGFDRSLLERMNKVDAGERQAKVDPIAITESIVHHLRKLLNVREGSVMTLPDFGMPDLNDLGADKLGLDGAVRRAIKHLIETYEPRLEVVAVHSLNTSEHQDDPRYDPSQLKYRISARLTQDDRKTTIGFSTSIRDNGRVDVEG